MPTYIVRSGDFTGTVETPFEAAPDIIAEVRRGPATEGETK